MLDAARSVKCVSLLQVLSRTGVCGKFKFDLCSIVEVMCEGNRGKEMNKGKAA